MINSGRITAAVCNITGHGGLPMIKYKELELIAKKWDSMTTIALNLQELPLAQMQVLLCDTYRALTQFHKDSLVPKEITQILLNIEEYLYFASLMEETEVPAGYYCYRQLCLIVNAFKEGFFNAEYAYAFPQLQIFDDFQNAHIINLERNFLPL